MSEIPRLRKRIDEIDDQLLLILSERVKICRAIGAAKKKQGKAIHDATRENEIYKRLNVKAIELGLDAGQVMAVYREIVNICSAVQE